MGKFVMCVRCNNMTKIELLDELPTGPTILTYCRICKALTNQTIVSGL